MNKYKTTYLYFGYRNEEKKIIYKIRFDEGFFPYDVRKLSWLNAVTRNTSSIHNIEREQKINLII